MYYRYIVWLFVVFATTFVNAENKPSTSKTKWSELTLKKEYVIEGMEDANLSGIAKCDKRLWVVSDRSDYAVYELEQQNKKTKNIQQTIKVKPEYFELSYPPSHKGLAWWGSAANFAIGQLRGGILDFEGVTCDKVGNRYLVSEAYLGVLKLDEQGVTHWLDLPDMLWEQTAKAGLLKKQNQTFEGIAIDETGKHLWLVAERNKRGIMALTLTKEGWRCPNEQCILVVEEGVEAFPEQFRRKRVDVRDFSDIVYFDNKLFTLERNAYRICRRSLENGAVEKCWSIARDALAAHRQYKSYGMPEALWIDADGAWVGIDNDLKNKRIDGEFRPIVWHFSSPKEGWSK